MRDEKNTKTPETLIFGGFRYDCNTGQLTDPTEKIVHMRSQSADVLAVLAQNAGEIVSKDDLMESVWRGVVTTDDSLVQCIADIRRAVGREAIKTFPKRGYQLNFEIDEKITPLNKSGIRRPLWLGLVACLALAAVLAIRMLRPDHGQNTTVLPIVMQENTLAVLPFANLSGNPEIQYFSNGLSADLSTDLSKVTGLTVISHASSFKYPNAESGFKKIAQDLGVRYLVRGTVRHEADRVRINVALVDVLDGFNIWADRYDRERSNPFDVQEEVTREIVGALSLVLGMESVERRVEPDAYYTLLRGLESLRELSASANAEARQYFLRAIALDPQYARAHASIAITFARETVLQTSEYSESSIEKGLEAAITAIQLNPDIPEAYYALGWLNLGVKEFDNALAAARHAIKLDSNYSEGYALLAEVALYAGDLNESLIAIKRAKLLHPHHPPSYHWTEGHILYQLGRFEDAQLVLEEAANLNNHFYQGLIVLAANYGQLGNSEAASLILSREKIKKPPLDAVKLASKIPYGIQKRRAVLIDGLRKAEVDQVQ